jgi:hypothetical protein
VYNYCTSIQQPVHGASIAPPLKQGRGRKGAAAASGQFLSVCLSVRPSVCLSVCLSVRGFIFRIGRRRGQIYIVQGVYYEQVIAWKIIEGPDFNITPVIVGNLGDLKIKVSSGRIVKICQPM